MRKYLLDVGYGNILVRDRLKTEFLDGAINFEKPDESWVDENIQRNSCKKQLKETLIDMGYSSYLINKKLGIVEDTKVNIAVEGINRNIHNTYNGLADKPLVCLRSATKISAINVDIYEITNFLTDDECEQLINIINSQGVSQSLVVDKSNLPVKSANRTSHTCYFTSSDQLITDVETRIYKTLGLETKQGERIQGQKYQVGDEFKVHSDYFNSDVMRDPSTLQRSWTFMIYLNNVEDGGYTSFPFAYFANKPSRGTALVWNNLDRNNVGNEYSHHCGLPVVSGEKYILTKWIKVTEANSLDSARLSIHNFLPIFHKIGFEKINVDLDCIKKIKAWMDENEQDFVKEVPDGLINANIDARMLWFNKAPKDLQDEFIVVMKAILCDWIGYKSELVHHTTYGIREYKRDSVLLNHYDRINTHVISAIIHLDDKSDEPWPLYIEDHNFKPHQVTMKYGDIVLYESTTCLHGRPSPFKGDSHRNMYIHFQPLRWSEHVKRLS
jgi:prolyl 4-hydroxylase